MDPIIFASLLIFFFLLWFFYTAFFGAEFYPTTRKKMQKMLEFASLKKSDVVYDLGCGDGRLVVAAAKKCKNAVGIEIDPLRFLISLLKIKILRLKNAKIIFEDLFKHNLQNADVIFLFLHRRINYKLQKKFIQELKPRTRVVSHYWIFHGWKPVKKDEKLKVYLYIIGKSNTEKP